MNINVAHVKAYLTHLVTVFLSVVATNLVALASSPHAYSEAKAVVVSGVSAVVTFVVHGLTGVLKKPA